MIASTVRHGGRDGSEPHHRQRARAMDVHGGHGARRRFLERDTDPTRSRGSPVWRKEVECPVSGGRPCP
jgi:hypothetical protein